MTQRLDTLRAVRRQCRIATRTYVTLIHGALYPAALQCVVAGRTDEDHDEQQGIFDEIDRLSVASAHLPRKHDCNAPSCVVAGSRED